MKVLGPYGAHDFRHRQATLRLAVEYRAVALKKCVPGWKV